MRVVAPNHAVLGEQQLVGAAPGTPLEEAAVVPQVAHGLACDVGQKHDGDVAEDAQSPCMPAVHGLVDIEGRAAVFGLLGAVPQPQSLQAWFGALQCLRVAQHPVGKDGGEVLGGRCGGHMDSHVAVGVVLQALGGPALQHVVVAQVFQVSIEQGVDTPVGGFLANEALHFSCEALAIRFWQGF